MYVLSLPKVVLSNSRKALMTRGAELAMLSSNAVFSSMEIQSARAILQWSAKKAGALMRIRREETLWIFDKSPLFALLACSRLPDCLCLDTVADLLRECLRCLVSAIASSRGRTVLELMLA